MMTPSRHFEWRDVVVFLAALAVLVAGGWLSGCMTTPDGRVVIDQGQLMTALETLEVIYTRIRALDEDPPMTAEEVEAERARLETQRAIVEAIIERLRNGGPLLKSGGGNANQLQKIRQQLGLE